jgi:hypothetical protein
VADLEIAIGDVPNFQADLNYLLNAGMIYTTVGELQALE